MELISDNDLDKISGGGTNVTGTLVSAIGDVLKIIYQSGHAVGSSIRRFKEKELCQLSD